LYNRVRVKGALTSTASDLHYISAACTAGMWLGPTSTKHGVTPLVFARQHAHPSTFASQGFIVLPVGMQILVIAGTSAVRNSVATDSSMISLLRLLTAARRPYFLRRCRVEVTMTADSSAA
jgi:hypothetical protein